MCSMFQCGAIVSRSACNVEDTRESIDRSDNGDRRLDASNRLGPSTSSATTILVAERMGCAAGTATATSKLMRETLETAFRHV